MIPHKPTKSMRVLFTDDDSRMEVGVNSTGVTFYTENIEDDDQCACIIITEDDARELIKFLIDRLK